MYDEAIKPVVDIKKLKIPSGRGKFVIPCVVFKVEFSVLLDRSVYLVSSIEIIEDPWHAAVSQINSSVKKEVNKLDTKVVRIAKTVKKLESLIKEKAEANLRHQVDAIIDDF